MEIFAMRSRGARPIMRSIVSGPLWRRAVPLLDQAIVSLGNFLTVFLCARKLGQDDLGQLGILVAIYIGCFNLNVACLYSTALVEAARSLCPERYVANIWRIQLPILAVNVPVSVLIFFCSSGASLLDAAPALLYVALFFLFQQLADFARRIGYFRRLYTQSLLVSVLTFIPRSVLLVTFDFANFEGAAAALSLSFTLVFPIILILIMRLPTTDATERRSFRSGHLVQARWLIMSAPVLWALGNLPIFILNYMIGLSAVALYTTARSFAGLANIALEAVDTYLSGVLASKRSVGPEEYRKTMFEISLVATVIWLLSLFFLVGLGRQIFLWLGLGRYDSAIPILVVIWFSKIFDFGGRMCSIHLRIVRDTKSIFLSSVVSLALTALTGPLWIILLGASGGAMMNVIDSGLGFVLQLRNSTRLTRISREEK